MTDTTASHTFQVRDGDKELRFTGLELGHSSSQRAGKDRWSEIWIYRTDEGSYLVAGVGRSTKPNEQDRWWAQVFTEPERVVDRLYLAGEGGVKRLPFNNREALVQACRLDRPLSEAYTTC